MWSLSFWLTPLILISTIVCDYKDVEFMKDLPLKVEYGLNIFPEGCMQNWIRGRSSDKTYTLPPRYIDFTEKGMLDKYMQEWMALFKTIDRKYLFAEHQISSSDDANCMALLLSSAYLLVEYPRHDILIESIRQNSDKSFWERIKEWFRSSNEPADDSSYYWRRIVSAVTIIDKNKVMLRQCFANGNFLLGFRAALRSVYTAECALYAPLITATVGRSLIEDLQKGMTNEYQKLYSFFASFFKHDALLNVAKKQDRAYVFKSIRLNSMMTDRVRFLRSLGRLLAARRQTTMDYGLTAFFNMMESFNLAMFWGKTKTYDSNENLFWRVAQIFGEALFDGGSIETGRVGIVFDRHKKNLTNTELIPVSDKGDDICLNWMSKLGLVLVKTDSSAQLQADKEVFDLYYADERHAHHSYGSKSEHLRRFESEVKDELQTPLKAATTDDNSKQKKQKKQKNGDSLEKTEILRKNAEKNIRPVEFSDDIPIRALPFTAPNLDEAFITADEVVRFFFRKQGQEGGIL